MTPYWAAGLIGCLMALHPAAAERVFLVVAASSQQPAGIAAAAARLAPAIPQGLTVSSRDCGDPRPVFAFATAIVLSRASAERVLETVKRKIADAFIKPCDVKPVSLLALRMNAVDPSIAGVPKDAVNWTKADGVSTVWRVDPETSLVIVRRFVGEPNDPLEGRRSRVLLVGAGRKFVTISDTCYDPAHPAITPDRIALDCVREEAGNNLLHAVEVTARSGQRLLEIPRCRTPIWADRRSLTCEEEAVRADGKLVLRPKRVLIDGP
jgi:uncharacterized C2H2 Zn-finger protein